MKEGKERGVKVIILDKNFNAPVMRVNATVKLCGRHMLPFVRLKPTIMFIQQR